MFISIILITTRIAAKHCNRTADYVYCCIVKVVCLFLLLSYPTLTSTSLLLLRPLKFDGINGIYTYLSPHIKYFSNQHATYASVALLCGLLVTIGFPLLLVIKPIILKIMSTRRATTQTEGVTERRDHFIRDQLQDRIKQLLDQLQDCYKDQHRWFAAYYLICRLVIMLITYYADDCNYMIYYLQTACVVIAMTHIWIQPYKNDLLNKLDTVILLVLLLIVNLSAFDFSSPLIVGVTISLATAPLILLAGIAVMRLLRHIIGVRVRRNLVTKLQQGVQRIACW